MLHLAIIQSNLHWQNKQANLQQFATKIAALKAGTQLVILPEMFTTGFSMDVQSLAEDMDGETMHWLRKTAIENKKIICGSLIIKEDNKFYNRFIWMQPDGIYYAYDKRHLFAMADEHLHFSAGKNKLVVQVNGYKIALQICYDLRFPVWARQKNNSDLYDAIIYVANWPQTRIEHWDALLQARAIENQCYVLACNRVGQDANNINYNGHSQVILPNGKIQYKLQDAEDVIYTSISRQEIDNTREQFPFLQDADDFLIL